MDQQLQFFRNLFLKPLLSIAFVLILAGQATAANTCQSLYQSTEKNVYPDKAELEALFRKRDNLSEAEARRYEEKILLPKFIGLAKHWAAEKAKIYKQIPADDIHQAALLGLVEAMREYKADSAYMFSTFAWASVQDRILQTIGALYPGAAKVNHFYLFSRVTRLKMELKEKLKRETTVSEIAAENEKRGMSPLPEHVIQNLLQWNLHLKNIQTEVTVSDNRDEANVSYRVPALDLAEAPGLSVEERVVLREFENGLIQNMQSALATEHATARGDSLEILLGYLGLKIAQEKSGRSYFVVASAQTFRDIADAKGISQARVSQIIEKSKRRIANSLRNSQRGDFIPFFEELFTLHGPQ